MDDALLVRGIQSFGNLERDLQSVFRLESPSLQPFGQRLAFHQLQNEEVDAVRFLEPMDGGNSGMVERGEEPGLPPEAGESFGRFGEFVGENLDRDLPPDFVSVAR